MRVKRSVPFALTLALLVMVSLTDSARIAPSVELPSPRHTAQTYGHFPISFEVNQGQTSSQARFLAHGPNYSLFLTPEEALLALSTSGHVSSTLEGSSSSALTNPSALASTSPPMLVGVRFLNANPQPKVTGEQPLPGVVNYFLGNDPARWHTNIPTYEQVRYHNIYPGIDLVYSGTQGQLEYDFIVNPDSDPSQIHLGFAGTHSLSLDPHGELLLHLSHGDISQGAPQAYQQINGVRHRIASSYVLQGTTNVGFALGGYDPGQPLVIDPTVFFSTYLGGLDNDYSTGVAVDGMGNAYITGSTSSTNFPAQNPLQSTLGGSSDVFVTKVNAAGTALLYSTYLGGSAADWGTGIAVDSAGDAYITGVTFSADFPTHNALQPTFGGGVDHVFVAKVNAAGTALLYSTYLGGSAADWGMGIAVDGAGNAYVTGGTSSTNFPTHTPLQAANTGTANAFVAKVNAAGTALLYSTYLGGSNYDYGAGIAVDGAGNAYVTGTTHSSNFPTHTPLQSAYAGSADAFVTKVNAAGTALLYSTYLGGSADDWGTSIALDNAGNAYVTGGTSSTNFPTHTPLQATSAGGSDGFIARLNASGAALLYSSYLGGKGNDWSTSIALDNAGNFYMTGATASADYPTANPLQVYSGMEDGFLVKMDVMAPPLFQVSPSAVAVTTTPGSSPSPQTLTLSNAGDAPLNWTASSLPSWVSVSPTSGTIAASGTQTLNLTFNTPSTTPQTYTTNLVLSDPNAPNSPLTIPITVVSATASKTWYFAEGYTGPSFDEYLTLENPNPSATTATVEYFFSSGTQQSKTYPLPAHSRTTLTVNDEVGANQEVSLVVSAPAPIVAERPMYFTYDNGSFTSPGGSDVLGATQLGTSFDFGYLDTTAKHDTYLTILNQNASAMTVTIQYFGAAGGSPISKVHSVAAQSRGTVLVNEEGLAAGTYSALVSLSEPGLVERPMYLQDGVTGYTGSADVIGVAQPQQNWYFAEGYTNTTFSERCYLSNPNQSGSASATVTFFRSNGSTTSTTVSIPAGGQVVVNANSLLGTDVENSAQVNASLPILAERFMSFSYPGDSPIPGATDVLGASAPSHLFYFAEGYTGAGFTEYLTIENPSASQTATVSVTFYPEDGSAPTVEVYTIAPSSRFTLDTGEVMPNQSFAMVVESNVPIVAERPMYFSYGPSGQTGGSDIIGYQP